MSQGLSERKLIFLLATVQFVNILDFMMVMPLGPDFALALGIPTSRLGIIAGSYTAAAALAGIIGAIFLDRFDRRRALAVAMLGLAVGTASGALAHSFGSLLAARILAAPSGPGLGGGLRHPHRRRSARAAGQGHGRRVRRLLRRLRAGGARRPALWPWWVGGARPSSPWPAWACWWCSRCWR
jgi:MFS family permease